MRLSYHPDAEAELVEAATYYEGRSTHLGERFLHEYDETIARILASPGRWPIIDADLRCVTMTRFPFGIYYRVFDHHIRILVIKHHSRHPDYWRRRLTD